MATAKKEVTKEPELIRKITGKNVMVGVTIPTDKATALYHVLGIVKSYKCETADLGDYILFTGDFLATRLSDGAEFRAPKCILQKPLDDVIANQYDAAIKSAGEEAKGVAVDMAIEIGVKPEKTPTGYQWVMTSLIPMAKNNALESIKERVQLQLENKS